MKRQRRGREWWDQMRVALVFRSGGRCEFCGEGLSGGIEVHHRKLRSQGGTDDEVNLAIVHSLCHLRAHQFPAQAREWGWIVPSWADPAEVPVTVIRSAPD